MKVLITGGQGFVGKYLADMMDTDEWLTYSPSHWMLDVTRPEDFDKFKGFGFDAVVHLAGLLMINQHKPEDYFRVNAYGTYNVLEFCRTEKIPKLIYAMTHSDVNASSHLDLEPYDQQVFKTGSWDNNSIPFISSKIAAADMVEAYNRTLYPEVFNGIILRLANIRGYGSQDTKYNSPFHQFIDKAIKGEDIEIWGNPPKTQRDMIYVKDVCSCIIAAIKTPKVRGYFNVGSGVGLTIEDEARAIIEVFGSEVRDFYQFRSDRIYESPKDKLSRIIYRPDIPELRKVSCIFNIDKTKKILGWEPKYSYIEALEDMKKEMGI